MVAMQPLTRLASHGSFIMRSCSLVNGSCSQLGCVYMQQLAAYISTCKLCAPSLCTARAPSCSGWLALVGLSRLPFVQWMEPAAVASLESTAAAAAGSIRKALGASRPKPRKRQAADAGLDVSTRGELNDLHHMPACLIKQAAQHALKLWLVVRESANQSCYCSTEQQP